ncbi:hypothetical protein CW306_09125 [Bacillus sp. BA3]|nr:hypothetical protein CW306_09125 [Bacillus sp. BA3]
MLKMDPSLFTITYFIFPHKHTIYLIKPCQLPIKDKYVGTKNLLRFQIQKTLGLHRIQGFQMGNNKVSRKRDLA